MAIIRNKEIRGLSKEEADNKLKDLRIELMKAKAQKGKKIKEIKRTIARILTIKNK
jgi:ribosomal protein L29